MFLLGQLVKGQEAANQRMDEITQTQREQAQVQRQQAASLEELIQDNAKQHAESSRLQAEQYAETAEKLGALVEDLADLKGEVRTLKEQVNNPAPKGPSEGRKDNSFENAGKIAAFFKTYTPWFYAFGVAVVGAIVAWMEHRSKGGGPPTP